MKRRLVSILVALVMFVAFSVPAMAVDTTADVNVSATPNFVGIAVDIGVQNFAGVDAGVDEQTTTSYFTIDNTSSVQTDQTIGVTTTTWAGGNTWAHSETATGGADTAGLKS